MTDTDSVTKTIEPDEILEKELDAQGRLYLGRDLAGKRVAVAYELRDE